MLQRFNKLSGIWVLTAFCCWFTLSPVQGKPLSSSKFKGEFVSIELGDLQLRDSLLTVVHAEHDSSKSKVLAAILALPFPFGMLGLHRMYLGAKPIIPILYIVTIGGGVGILPFIDMMVIILSKDTKPFFKNSKILMWYKKEKKKKKAEPILQ